jgi:aspartate-semialdehyde dehydrogenase
MRIILSAREVQQVRKVAYKFHVEDQINKVLEKMHPYGYIHLKEDNNGMEINLNGHLMDKVTGALSAIAPKVVQVVGAIKAVVSLTTDLFSEEAMKELDKFDLYLNPFNKICDNNGNVTLEVSEDGQLIRFCEGEVSKESINSVVERMRKDYDSHKELQFTSVGKNVADTIYRLERAAREMEAK